MKRRVVIFLLCFSIMIGGIVLAADYYRAIFVSQKNEENRMHAEAMINSKETLCMAEVVNHNSGRATIRIFGEILAHENVLNDANRNAGGKGERSDYASGFDFKPMFLPISEAIATADFSICNVSSLIGAREEVDTLSGYPLFNSPKKLGEDLISLGFDAVNIASNHMLDYSDRGYINSVQFWKEKDIRLIGLDASTNAENMDSYVSTVNGIRIGLLSYVGNTNGIYPQSNKLPIPYYAIGSTAIRKKKLKDDIQNLKNISDFVIVLVNWENESGFQLSERQAEVSKILSDAGADVIVGTGPKVIQKMLWLDKDNTDRKSLCFYSVGNLLCTMKYTDNLLGGYLSLDLEKNDENEVELRKVIFTPTMIHYDENVRNIRIYPLSEYSEDSFYSHGSNILYGSDRYERLNDILANNIPYEQLSIESKR